MPIDKASGCTHRGPPKGEGVSRKIRGEDSNDKTHVESTDSPSQGRGRSGSCGVLADPRSGCFCSHGRNGKPGERPQQRILGRRQHPGQVHHIALTVTWILFAARRNARRWTESVIFCQGG